MGYLPSSGITFPDGKTLIIAPKRIFSAVGNFLLAGADVYAVFLCIYFGLRVITNENQFALLGLVNSLMPIILLPALALLIMLLFFRRWRHATLFVFPVAVFFVLYGGQFLPTSTPAASGNPIRLMTFNILATVTNPERVEQVIRSSDADIVVLQELTQPFARRFEETLIDIYPYQMSFTQGNSYRGTGIYSRYPIVEPERIEGELGHLRAEIRYTSGDLDATQHAFVVYSVHPPRPGRLGMDVATRSREIAGVLERSAQETLPVILMGDFNMTDQSDDWQRVAEHYTDSFREAGWGFGPTWPDYTGARSYLPGLLPLIRIDYIWHSPEFAALEAFSLADSGGSDHHPVVATLSFPE